MLAPAKSNLKIERIKTYLRFRVQTVAMIAVQLVQTGPTDVAVHRGNVPIVVQSRKRFTSVVTEALGVPRIVVTIGVVHRTLFASGHRNPTTVRVGAPVGHAGHMKSRGIGQTVTQLLLGIAENQGMASRLGRIKLD